MLEGTKNHFELFGLPLEYRVDKSALTERYRELQKLVHPDRFASGTDQEQRIALQRATLVNEAYDILRSPLRRAMYMLELHGVELNQETATTRDGAFLMQQMELREALAEVRQHADPEGQLEQLMRQISSMIKEQIAQLAVQLESESQDQIQAACESVSKLQFLNKLHSEAEAVEADLEENY